MSWMKQPEADPILRLIEVALEDLAVRTPMFIARRRQDGDGETFVIQMGEDGRLRIGLPDPASGRSLEAVEYEEPTWPQDDVRVLAPILCRRLARRGVADVVTVAVRPAARELVAEVGIGDRSPELIEAVRDAEGQRQAVGAGALTADGDLRCRARVPGPSRPRFRDPIAATGPPSG